jgi:hypothetical protein
MLSLGRTGAVLVEPAVGHVKLALTREAGQGIFARIENEVEVVVLEDLFNWPC